MNHKPLKCFRSDYTCTICHQKTNHHCILTLLALRRGPDSVLWTCSSDFKSTLKSSSTSEKSLSSAIHWRLSAFETGLSGVWAWLVPATASSLTVHPASDDWTWSVCKGELYTEEDPSNSVREYSIADLFLCSAAFKCTKFVLSWLSFHTNKYSLPDNDVIQRQLKFVLLILKKAEWMVGQNTRTSQVIFLIQWPETVFKTKKHKKHSTSHAFILNIYVVIFLCIIIIIIIYCLTAKVVGAQQIILQPVSSIFPCFPLPTGTWRTQGLSSPWCCLPTSSCVSLVFFPLSLYIARWFWPHLMSGLFRSSHVLQYGEIYFFLLFFLSLKTLYLALSINKKQEILEREIG